MKKKALAMMQITVNAKKRTALLNLNRCFYPEKAVLETAIAFRGLCSADLKKKSGRLLVGLKMKGNAGCRETALAFANHALAAAKELQ